MKRLLFVVFVPLSVFATEFGVVAHVTGRYFDSREKLMAIQSDAGLRLLRTDFVPHLCCDEKLPNVSWKWDRFDAVLDSAERHGIRVLPILAMYGCGTAWKKDDLHHDFWFNYVSNVVTRYRGRVKEWEIWNEQNHPGFWPNPNPSNYVALLKPTYRLIKSIDPSARVIIGGTAGLGTTYFRGVYQAGGKAFFDAINCHPYSYPNGPVGALDVAIDNLRAMMSEFGDEEKDFYITEHGWPTQKVRVGEPEGFLAALKILRPGKTALRAAYIPASDGDPTKANVGDAILAALPKGSSVDVLSRKDIGSLLANGRYEVVFYPFTGEFAAESADAVVEFVARGGILVDFGGLPMGVTPAGAEMRRRLRISALPCRTPEGTPFVAKALVTPRAESAGWKKEPSGLDADVFFDASLLKPGDELIPLLTADKNLKDFDWPTDRPVVTGIYRYGTDMKGAVVVSARGFGKSGHLQCGTDERNQALFFRQTIEICRAKKVKAYYLYALQTRETDPYYREDHFGIIHADCTPKPAYTEIKRMLKR